MIGGCTNYLATMPEITVYMNCDTRLAINLRMFDLSDNDEFIFAIKNYDYNKQPWYNYYSTITNTKLTQWR